jgi:hypothetical protein
MAEQAIAKAHDAYLKWRTMMDRAERKLPSVPGQRAEDWRAMLTLGKRSAFSTLLCEQCRKPATHSSPLIEIRITPANPPQSLFVHASCFSRLADKVRASHKQIIAENHAGLERIKRERK